MYRAKNKVKGDKEILSNKIEKAVRKDIKEIMRKVGKERIYSVALVTDSDCITLYMALNTYEYMKKRMKSM